MKERTRLLPLPEAADRLGVTVATIRAWIYRRSIEYVKIGRSVRISESVVEGIIERGFRPALEQAGILGVPSHVDRLGILKKVGKM